MSTPSSKTAVIAAAITLASTCAAIIHHSKTSGLCKTSEKKKETYLFVGDIGGTNTRLSIYATDQKEPLHTKTYSNEEYFTSPTSTFENTIFPKFLSEECTSLKDDDSINLIACFAVAGPVHNNKVTLTNLGGVELDGSLVENNTNGYLKYITKCKIINDFVGQGYGLLDLDEDDVVELTPNAKQIIEENSPLGPKACVGAGTGLGECFLVTSSLHPSEGYECYPSEGGHVDFVPRDALQVELLNFLKEKFGGNTTSRISVERVVSGKGLANVYEFLAQKFPKKVRKDLHDEFEKAGALQGRVVGVSANDEENPCELCVQAMEIMMSAYGAEVGNCAVKYIPTGGLYVSGGLTPKNIKFIQGKDSPFMKAYFDKGRMTKNVLSGIPLLAVLNEGSGLDGARVCALRVRYKYIFRLLLFVLYFIFI